jgi:DNA topoisomerase I
VFRATGSTIASPGFMQVYLEGRDDTKPGDDDEKMLPPLSEGERVALLAIRHRTALHRAAAALQRGKPGQGARGIRHRPPSTYASIISTLQDREYVEMDKKRFIPTDVGRVVNRFLTQYFTQYVDYDFTAHLEDELDAVSRGEEDWIPLLQKFWQPFKDRIDYTQEHVDRGDVTQENIDEKCPKCGGQLAKRLGRNGFFIGCRSYPECDYTRNLDDDGSTGAEPEQVGRDCPECSSALVFKQGRYGKFIGCSAYPKCRYIEPLEKPRDTGVRCPKCTKGTLMQRKSRRGKVFYSCSTYPKCDYAVWNEPVAEPCPTCGWPVLTIKTTKRSGTQKVCPQQDCSFAEPCEAPPEPAAGAES